MVALDHLGDSFPFFLKIYLLILERTRRERVCMGAWGGSEGERQAEHSALILGLIPMTLLRS